MSLWEKWMISRQKRAVIELALFISIFTLPGFIFGIFLDLVIFNGLRNEQIYIDVASEIVKIGVNVVFLCAPKKFVDKNPITNNIYIIIVGFLFLNFLVGGRLWFIIQPLITLVARLAWVSHNLIRYVWSLFWTLIFMWVVTSWVKASIENKQNKY